MAERTVLYTTDVERAAAIQEAEAKGLTMKHDDFNVGPNGENRLTFYTAPMPSPMPALDPDEAPFTENERKRLRAMLAR